MEQWAQKPDKTCKFYLRVVKNMYISFSDEKNSLLHTHTQLNYILHFMPSRTGSKT